MRVQLTDPELMTSLLDFLRARDCIVEQLDDTALAVWCPPAERGDGGGMTCRSCGEPVAATLGRLGSLRCHDCRDQGGFETLLAGVYGHANGNGAAAQGGLELADYLAEWLRRHPGAEAFIG